MGVLSAPKDPEKRRPYFYIIRDKNVFGSPQPDGRGVQFLYQNDGRMINSAQLTGNVEDEKELELLRTVEGFRTLVHSIGISVEADDGDKQTDIEFVFQMYGKNDIYGGGSSLRATLSGDGMEKRIYLSEHEWTDDDWEPGQIRVIFDKPERMAKLTVRFYLNDGFEAPKASEEEKAVDFASEAYRAMISRSLMSMGNIARLGQKIKKARSGETVTVAYIGGSITQGAGAAPINTECYAYKAYKNFAEKFGVSDNVRFVKAGVGGTPSELGMIRFERDILRGAQKTEELPDIIVIEFAVNDEGDETKGVCYESLVKKALRLPSRPAVILLFSVFANDWNLQKRLSPVGEKYELPMVSVLDAVSPQFPLKNADGRVISKNQFFYDIYHPTNLGHTIMADCLGFLFDEAQKKLQLGEALPEDMTDELLCREPAIGADFEYVKLLDKKDTYDKAEINCGGFTGCDTVLQCVEMDTAIEPVPEFGYNWFYDGTKPDEAFFEMKICCKALVLVFKDSGDPQTGCADIFVDGKAAGRANPLANGWVHCNPMIILNEGESSQHTVRVELTESDRDKSFTILGFGYVE